MMPDTNSEKALVARVYAMINNPTAATLVSLLGAQLSQPQSSNALTSPNATQSAIAAMTQQMDSTGTNVLNKNLNIQPTLKIRPGYLFNVLVTRTMILPPYPLEAR